MAAEAPDALVEPASDWRELRRSPVVTVLLGVLAVVAATVAVIRIAASDEGGGPQTSPRAPGALATPGAPPPSAPAAAPGREVTLRTQAYSVAMPDSWHRRTRGGALSLSAPGGDVEVRIFFQRRPDLSVDEMVGEASSFLAGEHPGATVTAEGSRRTAGGSGPQLVAAYPGGSERALVLARGDVRYLILRRVDGGAAASLQRQSVAVQRSFNPR